MGLGARVQAPSQPLLLLSRAACIACVRPRPPCSSFSTLSLCAYAGGFDEACTEFIRVPGASDSADAAIRGITSCYDPCELASSSSSNSGSSAGTHVPLAAQLMGSNTVLLAAAAARLARMGAPRIDLNAGCPANVVTGGGAGSRCTRRAA